ncbi:unnamed protein product [Didymodactylos carnosus]|uniref:LamG domain-containing protein n=1 Tax=Didymodactylos carnosus TaxID=1234261 RepID=A0A815C6G2_9BILA|nr:unnamed protein product [Didymodactylos carnosus]CAF4079618.1 unnamed protein product [Didymodactylos carnosus]
MTNKCLIVAGTILCVVIVAAIVTPIVIIFTRQGSTNTTTATVYTTVVSAYWSFDNNANDMYGVYNGALTGSATYQSASSAVYGTGEMLYMYTGNSYFQMTTYFNLTYQSFTVDAWIYPTTISGDWPIFGQCTCSTCTNQCLYLVIRSGKLFMSFNYNDLSGSTTLNTSMWYHVAFVYNYATMQQIIYLDGVQDAIKSNSQPYKGYNGTITVGYSPLITNTYFSQYIDNVALTTRAKAASEILIDATQIYYFSFDQPNPYYDNGPNHYNGTANSLTGVSGRVNQAIRTATTSSYIQMYLRCSNI